MDTEPITETEYFSFLKEKFFHAVFVNNISAIGFENQKISIFSVKTLWQRICFQTVAI